MYPRGRERESVQERDETKQEQEEEGKFIIILFTLYENEVKEKFMFL